MKRKYLVAATALILASFLLGSAFAFNPNNPFVALWNAVFGLQDDVGDLQAQIDSLATQIPVGLNPDYDSGWVDAYLGTEETITFTHNLGSRDLFVYIYYRMSDPFPPIPGEETWTHNYVSEEEVYWIAGDLNEIVVYFNTVFNYWLQEMRVLIWKIPN